MSLAQIAIKAGQWFVEQEQSGLRQKRAPNRDPLAFAARQLPNIAMEQPFDLEETGYARATKEGSRALPLGRPIKCRLQPHVADRGNSGSHPVAR